MEKRIGKLNNKPKYVHFNDQFIGELSRLMKVKEKGIIDARQVMK